MIKFLLKNRAYATLVTGIAVATSVCGFEMCEETYNLEEVVTVLALTIIALLAALFLGFSFSALIRLPHAEVQNNVPRKPLLWMYVLLETALLFTASYLLNSLTMFIMPLIFLVLALYPIARYTAFLSEFVFGLSFAAVPVYIWAAIWGKFYTISNEFTFQPFILGIVIWFWASLICTRYGIKKDVRSVSGRSIFSVFGLAAARLAVNLSISIILGLLFFITVINGHTPVMWIGLTLTVSIFLLMSSRLQKSNENTGFDNFNKLSVFAISSFTIFQVADVVIEVFFIPN